MEENILNNNVFLMHENKFSLKVILKIKFFSYAFITNINLSNTTYQRDSAFVQRDNIPYV